MNKEYQVEFYAQVKLDVRVYANSQDQAIDFALDQLPSYPDMKIIDVLDQEVTEIDPDSYLKLSGKEF